MRIRLATADDHETVVRLRLAFIADVRGVDPTTFPPEFTEVTRRYLDEVVAADRIRTWLAVDDADEPVGIVSVLANDAPPLPEVHLAKEGYVVNMWVAPEARRRGIARALLDAALVAASTEGWRRLYLHATDAGRPLYEEAGFVADARWMGTPIDALR
ncbi:MAG TPA: GNAT family N-acetyltransferase [Aquihabitans sp.]|nr:GNAT family N-acetyltransferase [Aquihabitans sp.]